MSVGSRTQDDRRRRRLAVAGDGLPEASALAVLRGRHIDLPSAAPWLPRSVWKRGLIAGLFWLALIATAVLLIRPFPPHPQIAPAIDHLTAGPRPLLGLYADIVLWTLAANLATLTGWFRSHSQLDFCGRYRLWTWAAMVLLAWGFCAGTGIHTAIGAAAGPYLRWPVWRAETMVWLVPAMAAGLSVWWMVGRDFTTSRLNAGLMRLGIIALLLSGLGRLYEPALAHFPWCNAALLGTQYLGMGLVITGLWLHAGFVAYVSADPPQTVAATNWLGRIATVLAFLLGFLWLFRRAKPAAKKAAAAPKRRRKAAKPKRRSRTRVKPDAEEEAEEETAEEEATDESSEDAEEEEEEWTEEESEAEAEEETPAPAAATPARPATSTAPQRSASTTANTAEEEDESDDDDALYRVDGGHDPFKGLSKRQRRELKRQMREQQRQQRLR